jgi:hypothetical protein
MLQRIRASQGRVLNGAVAFIPANLTTRGNDLFR